LIAGISGITGGLLYAIYDIQNNKDGFLGKIYYGSVLDSGINWMKKQFNDNYQKIMYPSDDKLLPDFKSGPFYGDIPPGTPAPPLLVVDLERTLIGSVYDAKHGWRHVKRPGVDKFIDQLRQYYEIVIFSENDKGMTLDIMDAIGKEHTHKFGSSEAEVRDGIVIKRLDYMNRPLSKIVLIDDDPAAAQMFPRNTLLIKPFTNIYDKNDTALLELVPLLQALVHEGISDFRESFDALGTHDAHEASVEYKMRVVRTKSSEHEKRNRGLGKLIRGQSSITEDHKDDMSVSRVVPTPTEVFHNISAH
jgi:import inner membrane translocase subunit TIM50